MKMSKLKKKAPKWAVQAHKSTVSVNDMRQMNDMKSDARQAEMMDTFQRLAGSFLSQDAPSDGIKASDRCNCEACQAARAVDEHMKLFATEEAEKRQ